jgi:hypothetical protein
MPVCKSVFDSTQLNLGENATVVVDRFVYDPDAGTGEVVLKTGVAALRMATGKISEMQNKKIIVSAPFATVGVRGTDFWWGPIDGHFGVLLLSESKLDVRNKAGAVLIDKAEYGTDIHAMGAALGTPFASISGTGKCTGPYRDQYSSVSTDQSRNSRSRGDSADRYTAT